MAGLKNFELDGTQWTGEEVETKSDPVLDPGSGKKIVLRQFEYAWNPEVKDKPSKQEVFNLHAREIRNFLWRDGLRIIETEAPRMIVNDQGYRIFITCEPVGALLENAQNLTELLKVK